MRFGCDHDVDARVAARLRQLGHDAWTAADAGLSRVRDDELTVYSDNQRAVLVSHDSEFSAPSAQRGRTAYLPAVQRVGCSRCP
ncbi:MAG: DUF5615 family PIN-like protein [Pseudonocardiaceae bacterium]